MGNCLTYGNGCLAVYFCVAPLLDPGSSITQKPKVLELIMGQRKDGAFGPSAGRGAGKSSLSEGDSRELDEKGVVIIPIPKEGWWGGENWN